MKYLVLVLFFVGCFQDSFSQDGIAPITANPDLFGKNLAVKQKVSSASFDSTFVYLTDTLSLPFFDEF